MSKVVKLLAVLISAFMFVCAVSVGAGAVNSMASARTWKEGAKISVTNKSGIRKDYYFRITLKENGTLKLSASSVKTGKIAKLALLNKKGGAIKSGTPAGMIKEEFSLDKGRYYIKLRLAPGDSVKKLTYAFSPSEEPETVTICGEEYRTDAESLDVAGCGLTQSDVDTLLRFKELKRLIIYENGISDFSPLAKLEKLEAVTVGSQRDENGDPIPVDLNDFSDFKALNELRIWDSVLTDGDIKAPESLKDLSVTGTDITDTDWLAGFTGLEVLNLSNNDIVDIGGLSSLTELEYLDLSFNSFTDISPLEGLVQLKELNLQANNISDLSYLSGLTELEVLSLADTGISDISALKPLKKLTELNIAYNNITDISALKGMSRLDHLSASENSIESFAAFKGLKKLTSLELNYVPISDFEPFGRLKSLKTLEVYGLSYDDAERLRELLPEDCCIDYISYQIPDFEDVDYKPVIYFYPEETTEVTAELEFTAGDRFICTYPEYNGGWRVTAEPDGTLTDGQGRQYYCLYWESAGKMNSLLSYDGGFCVKGSDTAEFLREKLLILGLSEREINEFIIFWLPKMQDNNYNVISFHTGDYAQLARLKVSPAPDTVIRVLMTYYPSESFVDIAPQTLEPTERKGFTVVEWGGSVRSEW